MKILKIIPAIFLAITFNAYSQSPAFPIDGETKKITYSEVVTVNKTTKIATLKTRAENWVKGKKYLAKTKQEAGTYSFKGKIIVNYPSATVGKNERGGVDFICTLYLKDGKYKYVISNLTHVGENGRGSGGKLENEQPECGKFVLPLGSWTKIKNDVYDEMPAIISDMKKALSGTEVVVKKTNPANF